MMHRTLNFAKQDPTNKTQLKYLLLWLNNKANKVSGLHNNQHVLYRLQDYYTKLMQQYILHAQTMTGSEFLQPDVVNKT